MVRVDPFVAQLTSSPPPHGTLRPEVYRPVPEVFPIGATSAQTCANVSSIHLVPLRYTSSPTLVLESKQRLVLSQLRYDKCALPQIVNGSLSLFYVCYMCIFFMSALCPFFLLCFYVLLGTFFVLFISFVLSLFRSCAFRSFFISPRLPRFPLARARSVPKAASGPIAHTHG